jgi:MGT family glycosyltransferase
MEKMKSFLFVTWEGGGNIPPVLGLARRLQERGHIVRVLTEPCLKEAVIAIGAEFISFKKHFVRTDRNADIIKDWNSNQLNTPVIENLLINPAMDVANETMSVLESHPTDIMVADLMMVGSLVAAEAAGVTRVVLFHPTEYLPGPGRPPGGMGLTPATSYAGQLRDKLLKMIFNKFINQYLPKLNMVRKAYALEPYKSVVDVYHQPDLRLIQTSRMFDFPITPAPENVRYVGAILDDPDWSEIEGSLLDESDSRPLVVVGLSSTFQNQRKVLVNIIDAISQLKIRGLVTLGPVMAGETFDVPDNVKIVSSAPHSQIFPHADAVVTHAGHGTVMRALAFGLPVVCLPMGRDQTDNAARVVHHGVGLKLSPKAKSAKISKTIKRVLDEPGFTMQAKRLQKTILADAQADMAVTELENLA